MFERIRLFYNKGLWTAAMVRQAVGKGLLTEAQYMEITAPDSPAEEAADE